MHTPAADSDRGLPTWDAAAIKRFRAVVSPLISQLDSSVYSTYFREPVKTGQAKNYFDIIRRPMDLKSIAQRVREGRITNSVEFGRDVALIIANAVMYNGAGHHVSDDAHSLWREAQQ